MNQNSYIDGMDRSITRHQLQHQHQESNSGYIYNQDEFRDEFDNRSSKYFDNDDSKSVDRSVYSSRFHQPPDVVRSGSGSSNFIDAERNDDYDYDRNRYEQSAATQCKYEEPSGIARETTKIMYETRQYRQPGGSVNDNISVASSRRQNPPKVHEKFADDSSRGGRPSADYLNSNSSASGDQASVNFHQGHRSVHRGDSSLSYAGSQSGFNSRVQSYDYQRGRDGEGRGDGSEQYYDDYRTNNKIPPSESSHSPHTPYRGANSSRFDDDYHDSSTELNDNRYIPTNNSQTATDNYSQRQLRPSNMMASVENGYGNYRVDSEDRMHRSIDPRYSMARSQIEEDCPNDMRDDYRIMNAKVPFGGPITKGSWMSHLRARVNYLKQLIAAKDVKSDELLRLLQLYEEDLEAFEQSANDFGDDDTAYSWAEVAAFGSNRRHDYREYGFKDGEAEKSDNQLLEGELSAAEKRQIAVAGEGDLVVASEPGAAVKWDRKLSNLQFRLHRLWTSIAQDNIDFDANNDDDNNNSPNPNSQSIIRESNSYTPNSVRPSFDSNVMASRTNSIGMRSATGDRSISDSRSFAGSRIGSTPRGGAGGLEQSTLYKSQASMAASELGRIPEERSSYNPMASSQRFSVNREELDEEDDEVDETDDMVSRSSMASAWDQVSVRAQGIKKRVRKLREKTEKDHQNRAAVIAEEHAVLDNLEDRLSRSSRIGMAASRDDESIDAAYRRPPRNPIGNVNPMYSSSGSRAWNSGNDNSADMSPERKVVGVGSTDSAFQVRASTASHSWNRGDDQVGDNYGMERQSGKSTDSRTGRNDYDARSERSMDQRSERNYESKSERQSDRVSVGGGGGGGRGGGGGGFSRLSERDDFTQDARWDVTSDITESVDDRSFYRADSFNIYSGGRGGHFRPGSSASDHRSRGRGSFGGGRGGSSGRVESNYWEGLQQPPPPAQYSTIPETDNASVASSRNERGRVAEQDMSPTDVGPPQPSRQEKTLSTRARVALTDSSSDSTSGKGKIPSPGIPDGGNTPFGFRNMVSELQNDEIYSGVQGRLNAMDNREDDRSRSNSKSSYSRNGGRLHAIEEHEEDANMPLGPLDTQPKRDFDDQSSSDTASVSRASKRAANILVGHSPNPVQSDLLRRELHGRLSGRLSHTVPVAADNPDNESQQDDLGSLSYSQDGTSASIRSKQSTLQSQGGGRSMPIRQDMRVPPPPNRLQPQSFQDRPPQRQQQQQQQIPYDGNSVASSRRNREEDYDLFSQSSNQSSRRGGSERKPTDKSVDRYASEQGQEDNEGNNYRYNRQLATLGPEERDGDGARVNAQEIARNSSHFTFNSDSPEEGSSLQQGQQRAKTEEDDEDSILSVPASLGMNSNSARSRIYNRSGSDLDLDMISAGSASKQLPNSPLLKRSISVTRKPAKKI